MTAFQGLTQQDRELENLRESEMRYRALFESATDAIFLMNERCFEDCNLATLQMFGCRRDEIIGVHPAVFSPEKQEDGTPSDTAANSRIRTALDTGFNNFEWLHCRKDRTPFHAEVTLTRIDLDGSPRLLAIVRDITRRKQAENALKLSEQKHRENLEELVRQRTEELTIAKEKAESADRLKSVFLASMSHELRTPLNSIIGFAGMMLNDISGPLDVEQRDNLNRVYRCGKHLLSLITDIIDISKIEAGQIDVLPETFSVNDMLSEISSMLQEPLRGKRLTFHTEVPPGLTMHTDRKRLLQSVLNLLANAVKYTEVGRISIQVREREGQVEFAVADTGIGIAPDDMANLFAAFRRFDSPLSVKAGGTGLGLYLTRKLVSDLLGGTVTAQSTVGRGSLFQIRVPKELSGRHPPP